MKDLSIRASRSGGNAPLISEAANLINPLAGGGQHYKPGGSSNTMEVPNNSGLSERSLMVTNTSLVSQSKSDILDKFMNSQKQLTLQMKQEILQLHTENQQIKSALVEKSQTIKQLQQILTKRNYELQQIKQNCSDLDESNQKTAETYTSFREKFYQLEVFYDQQSEELRQELAECVKRFEEQQAIENVKKAQLNDENKKLADMLAKKNEVHLLLDEKYCEMLSDLDRMQRIIEKKDAEIIELKDNFIVSIKEIEQNLHDKIEQLLVEREQQKVAYELLQMEKKQMEEEKNKIINEQLYKIREIERVFVQPTKCIDAISARQSISSTIPLQSELKAVTIVQPRNALLTEDAVTDNLNGDTNVASTSNVVGIKRPATANTTDRAGPKKGRRDSKNNTTKKTNRKSVVEKKNTKNDSGINSSLRCTNSNHNTSKENNHMYTILSSSSDDSNDNYSYILRQSVRSDNTFVPDTSDTSDNFTRLKNSD